MTDERHNGSLHTNTTDRLSREECPTLELPEQERGPCFDERVDECVDEDDTPPTDEWIRDEKISDNWNERPSTIRMGWAKRDGSDSEAGVPAGFCSESSHAPADDTNPEMLIWQIDDQGDSLRETMRDEQAIERTQIIDMERVLEMDRVLAPVDDDHALTDLAGAVGHELNNPLTTCVGYLRQLSAMVPRDDDKMALMVDRLGRNLNRIHSIVGELEMLAAESSGHSERVDLATAVERVHDQLGSFLNAHVELQLRPAHLRTDRPRLYQLVYIMLAAYMLDSEGDNECSVRVSSRTVGACLEIVAPRKPQGSLRLDLLGILRRNTLDGSRPLGLAAELTRQMGGTWSESEIKDGYRVTAVLPRQSPGATSKEDHEQRPSTPETRDHDWSKTSPGPHWRSEANRFVTSPRSRR